MAWTEPGKPMADLTDLSMGIEKGVKVTVAAVDEEEQVEANDSDAESHADSENKFRLPDRKSQVNAVFDEFAFEQAKACAKKDEKSLGSLQDLKLSARGVMSKIEAESIIGNPREYQLELFERAKNDNIISVLPTGSGKTLIAVLLLQYIIDKELEDRQAGQPRRISFFLVELATLVYQQASVLEKNLTQPVARFCGEMNVDSWSKSTWKEQFDTHMAIVLTADVLYNCLASGFITMEEINLLILDEAHHTKKNHVYARIIRDFYRPTSKASRPKIFGTTASPVDAKVDTIQAARDLETMLDSKIATVKDPSALMQVAFPPLEQVSKYPRLQRPYATGLCSEIESKYKHTKLLNTLTAKAKDLTAELGEWCGDRWLVQAMTSEEGEKLQARAEHNFAIDPISRSLIDKQLEDIKMARKIVEDSVQDNGITEPKLSSPHLSGKVLKLKELLDDTYRNAPDTRCIVFVERRATAKLLLEVFRHHKYLFMNPALLIGSRQGEAGDQKISIREQLLTIKRFKSGEINVLFATSVAEEGLDIPLCNLVIRFDLYKTMIQYMQSRGRARHKDSRYIHMVEEGNLNHIENLKDVQTQERILLAFCQNQPPDRILAGLDADLDEEMLKLGIGDRYTEPSTGAKLLFGTVLGQLAYFAACVPRFEEAIIPPDYVISTRGKKFICEVLLPPGSPLRSMIGKEYPRKSLAKRSAAFEACMELRKRGLLDENLLPIYHKQLPSMRNAHLALRNKKGNSYELLLKPNFWEKGWGVVPTQLYALLLKADNPEVSEHPIAPMLLLTRQPLPCFPSFPVYPKPGIRLIMSLTALRGSLQVNEEQLQNLNSFTLRIFKDAFNKVYEENIAQMSYWLAPCSTANITSNKVKHDLIDWSTVDFVAKNERISWSPDMLSSELENRFFVDEYNGGHRYYSIRFEPKMKATDRPPAGVVKKDFMDTIVNWTSSLWKKSRQKVIYNPDQPVLLAYKLPLRRNWLDDWNDDDLTERTKAWICPEPLKISTLSVSHVVMAYILPALIWRIDAHLLAKEGCDMLDLDISIDLALEAMTKDSINTEEHGEEQIHLQRGMGKNYERLEFIGDAFLKMATSISLFARNAGDDEFESHVKRMLMICNKNLFNHAMESDIYKYIRTEGFNRRLWYPEGIILKEGKGAAAKKKSVASASADLLKHTLRPQRLNDKTIADVCESLIGASLLTQKDAGCMDMAVKAVTVLVKDENHVAECWDDYYMQYRMPAYQRADAPATHLATAKQVEEVTGYKFSHPLLLISAFTHPSYPFSWGHIPCYQRLEFLGDSLLDMVCVNFLFHRYTDKDPQWLTEHKMAMVSNKFLGALCVKLKFYKFLRKNSQPLVFDIANYVLAIEEAEAGSNEATDYWTTTGDPPKCLPDMVEAYIGAIFVDSQFNFKVVEDFFEKHVRWFFEDMRIYDTFANNHPTTFLAHLLSTTFHCSHFSIQAREMPPAMEGGPLRVAAGVMVHFKIVAHDQSSSSKYAKVRASKKAVEVLEKMKLEEFRQKFCCDCKSSGTSEPQQVVETIGTAI